MKRSIQQLTTFSVAMTIAVSVLTAPLAAKEFVSQVNAAEVIELYTSEGCSSCPPADRWLTSLKNNPDTFKSLIPMAFHVDYWDYIGWKDRFAKPAYSLRQRQYVNTGGVSQAYTPQMVVNSGEWREFISGQRKWVPNDRNVGVLKASIPDGSNTAFVRFSPFKQSGNQTSSHQLKKYVVNIAVLGMGLSSNVTAGENHDSKLTHDFVVLNHLKRTVSASPSQWRLKMPKTPEAGQSKSAVAIWLSEPGSQRIIQATGGYL